MLQQPIRVLQILPALHVGGVERGTLDWAIALKQMGHIPFVISGGGHGEKCLKLNGIKHITLPVGKKSLKSLLLVKHLRRLFIELKIDVVHARSRLPAWLSYLAIKKMAHKPAFVTTLHGLHTVSPYASVMSKGDAVIAVSKTASAYLTKHFSHHLKTPPVVIYRGIEHKEFPYGFQSSKDWLAQKAQQFPEQMTLKKVLLPGRFSEIKGGMGLIPWLASADTNFRLMLNAYPEESKFSRKFYDALLNAGLSERVMWLGIERDMKQLYAWTDVVLSVNKKPESFGRTVLEALSIGCPVIAFNHGGVSEVMSELFPQGLVSVNDWSELSEKINLFIQDPPKVSPHDLFSNTEQFEQTLTVYKRLLSKK
ncbi:glycosyltransferase [Marinicella rhabdoformis]|uniref:glycosyltransferase n=1 Tax=Marinicella rhabdoformis TaxID=2580566 RepID=UPI0012AED8BE|nr:glycosyltransferase [Marinicella rhabdoformis]